MSALTQEHSQDNLWQSWSLLEQRLRICGTAEEDYCRLVSDYTCISCRLATRFQQHKNLLLQEWCLRYCLFTLADCAARNQGKETLLRRLCLDQLYIPLLALQRLYTGKPDGKQRLNQLKCQLQQAFYSVR